MGYTPIKQRGGSAATSYTPVAQRTPEPAPTAPKPSLVPSVFGSTAQSTPSVLTPQMKQERSQVLQAGASTVGTFAQAAGQGLARAWAATGGVLAKRIGTANSDVIDPKNIFGGSNFGQALAETVFGRKEKFNATSEDLEFIQTFAGDTEVTEADIVGPAGSITLLLTALDLSGAGGVAKGMAGAVRAVRRAKTVEEGVQVAKALGLSDDIAQQYGEVFVRAQTAKEATAALEAAAKLQNTTTSRYTPVAERVSSRTVANVDNTVGTPRTAAWPTTASKPSTAGGISTGNAPTGRGGVSAQRADTSGPFDVTEAEAATSQRLRQLKAKSVPSDNRTMLQKAKDTFDTIKREGNRGFIKLPTLRQLGTKSELPDDPLFREAVKNTVGAEITENGLKLQASRYQTIDQTGAPSVRTGVFYLPEEKSASAKHYSTGKNGYGGTEKMVDETYVQKPIFVKGATGGKAPEIAYDLIMGKGAYQKMRADVLSATISWNRPVDPANIYDVLDKYGADAELAWHIVENSKGGNTLPYAVQENIVAHAVRNAGYDSVLGYSKKKTGEPYLSELFDVRETTYPEHGVIPDIHPDFYNKVKGGTPTGDGPFDATASGQTLAVTPNTKRAKAQKPAGQTTRPPARAQATSQAPLPPQAKAYSGSVPQRVYEDNRSILSPSRAERIKTGIQASLNSLRQGTDKLLGPISTRLKNIDPSLKRALRTFEFKLANAAQRDRATIAPFLKSIRSKNMSAADYADLDLALKNGDTPTINALISKHGLDSEYSAVRETLDSLYKRAGEVGYDIGYEQNYFPRMVSDGPGLLEYLQKGDDWSIIEEAIKAKEVDTGRYLTVQEKANLINTLVRGYGGKITLSETGAMKARRIDLVDAELNRFYRDSVDSLLRYIDDTNEAIEARRFFGKGDPEASIEDSIGGYILKLLSEGKVKPSQEKELRDVLQARFAQIGTSGIIKVYKNLSYIDTMGSFTSAITQIGDLAFALYKGGPVQTVKALGKAAVGRSEITRADIGIDKIAQEFEDASKSAQLVDKVFTLVGIKQMDTLGKETVINATIGKYRKLAEEPTTDFMRRLEAVFGNDTTEIIGDLKSGRVTENVKLLAFNELLDVQPVLLSEMPEQYLKSGNGRIFYMLKTYTIKLFDVYRNEIFHQMRSNPAQAVRNLLYLTGALVAMNATADEIKDLMLNRETPLKDRTVDNILKLAGFSKFTLYKAREEGIGSATARTILPPFKAIDAAYKDITKGEMQEIQQSIPVGGKLYYWWFGKGAEKSEKKRKQASDDNNPLAVELPELPALPPLPQLPALPSL